MAGAPPNPDSTAVVYLGADADVSGLLRRANPVDDPTRAAAFAALRPEELTADPELNAIADLVARGVEAEVALVTVVDANRQTFLAHTELPADLMMAGGTARAWSFCHLGVAAGRPIVIPDARLHPELARTPGVEMGLVGAYAGVPVHVEGVGDVGMVCALSSSARSFSGKDLATLELGARLVAQRMSMHKASIAAATPLTAPASPRARSPNETVAASYSSVRETLPQAASRGRAALVGGAIAVGDLVDGKYWITAQIGEGGQSEVFLARDRSSGKLVAIKVMRSPEATDTLLREAAALARARHPNIVELYGVGATASGQGFLILEYVDGESLQELLAHARADGDPTSLAQATAIIRELGGALATLHAVGVVHGDVKPGNVLWDAALDRSVLIDFGLRLARPMTSDGPPSSLRAPESQKTQPALMRGGTPGYSAPEQLASDIPTGATPVLDVYALGALAYALIVGQGPFAHIAMGQRVAAQLRGEITPPSVARPGLPAELDEILLGALSPDPAQRPRAVLTLADMIDRAIARGASGSTPIPAAAPRGPSSRGAAFQGYRAATQALLGHEEEAALLATLPAHHRAVVKEAVDDELYPSEALIAYLRALRLHGISLSDMNHGISRARLPGVLRTMRVTRTPAILLHVVDPLFHRMHHWGKVTSRRTAGDSAVVTLEVPAGFAPEACESFAGALVAVLALAAKRATVTHAACAAEGAPACDLRVVWTSAASALA